MMTSNSTKDIFELIRSRNALYAQQQEEERIAKEQERENRSWPTTTLKEREALLTERALYLCKRLGYPENTRINADAITLEELAAFAEIHSVYLQAKAVLISEVESQTRAIGYKDAWAWLGSPNWDTFYSSLILWVDSNA